MGESDAVKMCVLILRHQSARSVTEPRLAQEAAATAASYPGSGMRPHTARNNWLFFDPPAAASPKDCTTTAPGLPARELVDTRVAALEITHRKKHVAAQEITERKKHKKPKQGPRPHPTGRTVQLKNDGDTPFLSA
ncbi:hypothetical protein HPB48_008769 [Haemaphysalis longicornis]|uniref:Uncharacterized protein n=1 Tax=Haemaphysalis longicornis TaxID=44386 RepID=A0A9J6GPI2_HAELO|nr:hypothetical protein HPB48_008769 [Haemaphysalis longicornis]